MSLCLGDSTACAITPSQPPMHRGTRALRAGVASVERKQRNVHSPCDADTCRPSRSHAAFPDLRAVCSFAQLGLELTHPLPGHVRPGSHAAHPLVDFGPARRASALWPLSRPSPAIVSLSRTPGYWRPMADDLVCQRRLCCGSCRWSAGESERPHAMNIQTAFPACLSISW